MGDLPVSGLALVPAWFWIALGTILALASLVAGVHVSRDRRYPREHARPPWWWRPWLAMEWLALFDPRRWRYSRQQARHVMALTEAEGRDFYGSMTLDGERGLYPLPWPRQEGDWLPALPLIELMDPVPWEDLQSDAHIEEPTAAEVAASRAAHGYIPELEALDDNELPDYCTPHCPDDVCHASGYCVWPKDAPAAGQAGEGEVAAELRVQQGGAPPLPADPGPGGAPSLVGPVPPGPVSGFLVPGFALRDNDLPDHYERLADTGDIAAAHLAHPGPDTERLAWLDAQLEAHLEWARRVRGQVTGWGLEAAA